MADAIDNLAQDLNQVGVMPYESLILTDEGYVNTIPNPNFVEPYVYPDPPRFGLPPQPPGMFDPVLDYGSRQWLDRRIRAPEPAAPTTPANPDSQFENYLAGIKDLQAPVSSPSQPYTPTFTPMAAPPAVRVYPPTQFGPVTASGYAQPPVDPMSYYSDPEIIPESPIVGDPVEPVTPPTKFGPVTPSRYAEPPVDPLSYYSNPEINPEYPLLGDPDLSVPNALTPRKPSKPTLVGNPVESVLPDIPNVGGGSFRFKKMELSDPVSYYSDPDLINPNTLNQEQLNPVEEQLGTSATTIIDPITGSPIEVVVNPDFVEPRVLPNPPRLGLPPIPPGMLDPVMDYDRWKWVDRYIKKPDKPATPKEDENVKDLTEEEVKDLVGNQTPTPPVTPQPDIPIGWKYNVARDVITTNLPNVTTPRPYQFKEYPTTTYTGTTKREGRIIPFKMPTEVPIPPRRDTELLAPGRFQDINYDPDEILAAAMRVIRGRSAGRSLMY